MFIMAETTQAPQAEPAPFDPHAALRLPGPFGRVRPGARGWRTWLFPSVFLIYLAQPASGVLKHNGPAGQIIGMVVLLAFMFSYLSAMSAGRSERYRVFLRYYWAMVALCAIEAVFAHGDAFVMLVYIGVQTVASRFEKSVPWLAVMVAIPLVVPPLIKSWHATSDWGTALAIAIISLAMFGFFGLLRANQQLADARTEVARLAAENERSRIARDLHDLLGHSLTTITVKAGLASRLANRDPARAAQEISEVENLARQALTDVRAAVSGYREVSLGNELAAAREVLRAAGIAADLPGAIDLVGEHESELFAWVLREGVTNVVRHSRANRCQVRLNSHSIEIIDNGIGANAHDGNGLTGLRERVAAAGGTLSVATAPAVAGWRLRVEVPAA